MGKTYPAEFFDPQTLINEIYALNPASVIGDKRVIEKLEQIRDTMLTRLIDSPADNEGKKLILALQGGMPEVSIDLLRQRGGIQPHWEAELCRWDDVNYRVLASKYPTLEKQVHLYEMLLESAVNPRVGRMLTLGDHTRK